MYVSAITSHGAYVSTITSFNVKLAKRDAVSLARLRERAGERGNGHHEFHYSGRHICHAR